MLSRREGGSQQQNQVEDSCQLAIFGWCEDFGTTFNRSCWTCNLLNPCRSPSTHKFLHLRLLQFFANLDELDPIATQNFACYYGNRVKMAISRWRHGARRSLATVTILLALTVSKTTALSQHYCSSQNTGLDSSPGMRAIRCTNT